MKAITIWPEWVFAIEHLGKRVENRRWNPTRKGLRIGDRFALHAGKYIGGRPGVEVGREAISGLMFMAERAGWVADEYRLFSGDGADVVFRNGTRMVEFDMNEISRSAVVAVATLADVTRESLSPWAVAGEMHWELADVVVLLEPVLCRGHQMLWNLPAGVEIDVQRQINAATVSGEEAF